MKKIYIVIAALALSAGSFAQTADSLLRRQMELIREFNPTLSDADKINSLPALREPSVRKASTNYSTWAGRITPPLEIALPRPGNIMTAIPYSSKKGYLSFNAGNHANLDGIFGYHLIETEKNILDFSLLHSSTNGDINYVQDVDPASNRVFSMDNEGRLDYRHLADAFTLSLDLSYLSSLFNYYGNRFGNEPLYEDRNQSTGVLDVSAGIVSHESELLNYRGSVNLRNFCTKFGDRPDSGGIRGNEVNATAGFEMPFDAMQSRLGLDGKLYSTFYGRDFSDYFLVNAAPYITFGNPDEGYSARLGADVLFLLSGKTKVRVAPNVKAHWAITEQSSLYANIHGGFANNTFLEMMRESRYIRPDGNVRPSFTPVSVEAGAKIGEVSGFRFDIFGGFGKTDDEHFLILNGHDVSGEDVPGTYREVLRPVYGDLSHGHIGTMIRSNILAPLDISLRLKKNFYSLNYVSMEKIRTDELGVAEDIPGETGMEEPLIEEIRIDDARAYNKPGFEVDIRAVFGLTDYLKLTANYYFAGDRWSYYDGRNRRMDNISDFNAGALYLINDTFSINVRANNLFFRKYDIWYGHPAQGFNASGGFTFRF
ncbi:MAG: hypothetical protein LBH72_00275 [Proteiniphilum sp.]|jgi:hypothetical protein|nr:hypothetical protein [Proteiniphilum sp.]